MEPRYQCRTIPKPEAQSTATSRDDEATTATISMYTTAAESRSMRVLRASSTESVLNTEDVKSIACLRKTREDLQQMEHQEGPKAGETRR